MEIHELLTKASYEVDKADLPEDFKLKAFEKSIEILLLGNKWNTQNPSLNQNLVNLSNVSPQEESELSVLASKLKIPIETLEEIFYLDEEDGDLKLIIGTSQLDDSTAGATKEIALLMAGGRQLSEMEEWTSATIIRNACDYFGKYDSGNFANTIKSMEDVFGLKGSGQKREVKIKRPGIERLQELINDMIHASS